MGVQGLDPENIYETAPFKSLENSFPCILQSLSLEVHTHKSFMFSNSTKRSPAREESKRFIQILFNSLILSIQEGE